MTLPLAGAFTGPIGIIVEVHNILNKLAWPIGQFGTKTYHRLTNILVCCSYTVSTNRGLWAYCNISVKLSIQNSELWPLVSTVKNNWVGEWITEWNSQRSGVKNKFYVCLDFQQLFLVLVKFLFLLFKFINIFCI